MSKLLSPRLLWLAAALAAAFCAYGFWSYAVAGRPVEPVKPRAATAAGPVRAAKNVPGPGLYAGLAGGRMFFGEAQTAAGGDGSPGVYVSALVLRGIVLGGGRKPLAILARAGSPPEAESWTVSVGQTVEGETVVAINRDSVTLARGGQVTVLFLQ
ncbi:MAG: type II secretion system protein N [Patescibacteria group bacterium]